MSADYLSGPLVSRLLAREEAARRASAPEPTSPEPTPEAKVEADEDADEKHPEVSEDAARIASFARYLGVEPHSLIVEVVRAPRLASRLSATITPWIYIEGWAQPLRLVKAELRTQLESAAYSRIPVRVAKYDRSYLILGIGSLDGPS